MIPFTILTPQGVYLDEEVDSVLLPAKNGPMLLEKGITPSIVACLEAGVLKINFGKQSKYYAVFRGVARVKPERILLLAEMVEDGYELDMARAIAARDRNIDIIKEKKPDEDVRYAKASLAKSLARIKAKSLSEGTKDS